MACCIFIAWVFRLLIIRPIRAILDKDTLKGDAHQTAPRNIKWSPEREDKPVRAA